MQVMETKPNDDTRIALITNDIGYMKGFINDIKIITNEIKSDIKALDGKYVTQEQLKELIIQVNAIAAAQKEQINKQSGLQRFVPTFVSSVLTGVMVFLIIAFLNNVK